MSTIDRLWQGILETIKLNDKVEQLAKAVTTHQERLESLSDSLAKHDVRLARLETRYETTVQIAGLLRRPDNHE